MGDSSGALLTSAAITEATGEDAHERLEELEVIFGSYEQLEPSALRQCRALRRCTLLNARLQRIAHLEPVAATLVHLCLSNQRISKIEGLETLTQLRALYLHHNRIERIEGLDSCRKLQKLWLYDNRITHVHNLGCCSDLRELWLQSNEISTLASDSLSSLVNLQSLHLADNALRHVDEFQHLRRLVVLRDLSFRDEHFGSNPIAEHPDYRSFALAALKQTLEFNDRVAELTLAYQQELQSIAARQERGVSNAEMLQRELIEALNDVEACVLEGQAQIRDEKQRQLRLRDENARLLLDNVDSIKAAFLAAADDEYEHASQELEAEERQCRVMEMEATAEQEQALAIAMIQAMLPSRIAFQQLLEHTPDHRFIASAFGSTASPSSTGDGGAPDLAVLQIYRYFHRGLIDDFNAASAQDDSMMATATSGTELYLYMVLKPGDLGPTLQNGLASQPAGDSNQEAAAATSDWVFLFSHPATATRFYTGTTFDTDDVESDRELAQGNNRAHKLSPSASTLDKTVSEPPLVETYNLLLCRVRASQVVELFYPQPHSRHQDSAATTLESLLSIAVPREDAILPPPPRAFLRLELPAKPASGHVYMARRALVHKRILPQFLVLCSRRRVSPPQSSAVSRPPAIDTDSSKMVDELHRRLREEVDAFHAHLHHEMDPATARVRAQLLQQQDAAREQLRDASSQVADEKRVQSELLRALLPKR